MRVFISYHRADSKYRRKLTNILKSKGIEYYAVPENRDFNGWSQEKIRDSIFKELNNCNVFICLVGQNTYKRGHVDNEIHHALKGEINNRKGIISCLLPTRNDNFNNLDLNTYPIKLKENLRYTINVYWNDMNENIIDYINEAIDNSKNKKIITTHKNPCMKLRNTKYYDN